MSVASLASSHIQSPINPAVMLGVGGSASSGFALPGAAGVSGGGSSSLAFGSSASSSANMSTSLNALMLQIQQGTNALQGGASCSATDSSGIGTPGSVRHHHGDSGSSGDQASGASSSTGTDTGQTADAAASGSSASTAASTSSSSGGMLLGDMMQAMQTYAAVGGMLLV